MNSLKSRARGISLGLYAADLGDLRGAARKAADWGCGILHYDVMDGVFVPGMTAGPGVVAATDIGLLRDVHLMVQDPGAHVGSYIKSGADMICVHAESDNAGAAIAAIKAADRPVLAGLALMPGTTLDVAGPLLDLNPDMILVLSLDPRTKTPPDITAACARLRDLRARFGPDGPVLAFDGGVTMDSLDEIANCAPDMIVSGSAVFGAPDPKTAFAVMARAIPTLQS